MTCSFQPNLRIIDHAAAVEIRDREDLDWFHSIEVDGYTTRGNPFDENWRFVSEFLKKHEGGINGSEVLEPGCADGLWTCWLTKLGAKHIDASDIENREQFEMIVRTFGLPVVYYPGTISSELPRFIKRSYDLVASLGLLYHVHDPLTTLVMYVRYLREGGILLLETGAVEADEPYLHYTGTGEIYPREGANQFIPTIGFLRVALSELGMTVEDISFRLEGFRDRLCRPVGRTIIAARKTGGVGLAHYLGLLQQLDMQGREFPKQRWPVGWPGFPEGLV